ncbi:MAG: hypothetical protein ABMA15_00125 [Vicinamibacterales bacterium]
MADEFLQNIDQVFASVRRGSARRRIPGRRVLPTETRDEARRVEEEAEECTDAAPDLLWGRFTWIDGFIAMQFLWGALIFLPGAQQYRGYIRGLPYVVSLGMLARYVMRPGVRLPLARGGGLIICALILLVVNLLNPRSQLSAGIAQCVFQLSIAAPLFWGPKAVRSPAVLERTLMLVFVLNAAGAGLGVLQVYFPDRFMPPEFSSLGLQLNQYYISGLTYTGSEGRAIVRPPGLTDQPGAAATAGALTAIIGLGLLLRRRRPVHLVAIVAAVTVGFAAIYLSQVRSTLLATIGACALLSVVALRRGRFAGASWVLLTGGTIVVASFIWATSVGGQSVTNRFVRLRGLGAVETYRTDRGIFVSQTVGDLLDRYPLGAGVGRWGMINTYFGSRTEYGAAPLYVEIQITGWLLDGGVPMWLLYGGATLLSVWTAFSLTKARNPVFVEVAIISLSVQAYILVLSMGSPMFNTQMGTLFWTLAGALYGASKAADAGLQRGRSLV